jgi:hypothetical protein
VLTGDETLTSGDEALTPGDETLTPGDETLTLGEGSGKRYSPSYPRPKAS